ALGPEHVELLIRDEEIRLVEEPVPAFAVVLNEPAVILLGAARDGHERVAATGEDAADLGERLGDAAPRRVGLDSVRMLARPDVLEGRDAEHRVEGPVGELKPAKVADLGAEPG